MVCDVAINDDVWLYFICLVDLNKTKNLNFFQHQLESDCLKDWNQSHFVFINNLFTLITQSEGTKYRRRRWSDIYAVHQMEMPLNLIYEAQHSIAKKWNEIVIKKFSSIIFQLKPNVFYLHKTLEILSLQLWILVHNDNGFGHFEEKRLLSKIILWEHSNAL